MKRQLWGGLSERPDEASAAKQVEIDREIMMEKRGKETLQKDIKCLILFFLISGELKILHSSVFFEPKDRHIKLLSKNQTVNQIVGLKQKQDMIQELIETSITDQYGFQQLVPTLKESLEAIPSQIPTPRHNDKFNKICFIPPSSSTLVKAKEIQKVNKSCVQLALKKSICGLARLTDYTEISDSALTMFNDAVDHYFKSLMESIVTVLTNDDHETETDVDLMTFERAYFTLSGESATTFFNYFKREIHDKHQATVSSFTNKVSELKSIVDSPTFNQSIQPDFYQSFFVKEEIKQEFDDYET